MEHDSHLALADDETEAQGIKVTWPGSHSQETAEAGCEGCLQTSGQSRGTAEHGEELGPNGSIWGVSQAKGSLKLRGPRAPKITSSSGVTLVYTLAPPTITDRVDSRSPASSHAPFMTC